VNINRFGGTILTIAGTNFGYDPSAIEVSLTDDGTSCTVTEANSTSLTCTTNQVVDVDSCLSTSPTVTVNVNCKTQVSQETVTCADEVVAITSVTPNSASPVLHTIMVLSLDESFSGTIAADTTTITLISLDSENGAETDSTVRQMYITEVDDSSSPKTINIKFPGAESGFYVLKVETEEEGMWDCSNCQIQTIGEITDISPSSGSASGGTLITITGRHFSTNPLDNNIIIGRYGPTCDVLSTSDT
jgi:hypothetical protein